ncbi:unnamed protein product [Macrosiphum euphorbiae]|uniref:Uncharacterized protein n=1 Tax=Macrosiphum euphorbiae TaxID=13131 RepID=A0AAV0XTR8_9HEMI|nr:unnamed protein product [Macrosiphum euphorbiae]
MSEESDAGRPSEFSDSLECFETISDFEDFEDVKSDDEYLEKWSPKYHVSMFIASFIRKNIRRHRYEAIRQSLDSCIP